MNCRTTRMPFALLAIAVCVYFSCQEVSYAADSYYVIAVAPMKFKGDWDVGTTYAVRDIVFFEGSSWLSLDNSNEGNAPDSSPTKWAMLVQKGDKGDNGATGQQGPKGDTGPQGAPGPAVHTSAVCVDGYVDRAHNKIDANCSCSGRTVSKVLSTPGTYCRATSETGNCSAFGGEIEWGDGSVTAAKAACCVCAPN